MICPLNDKECMLITEERKCMFEILPHSEGKPFGQKECAIKAALLLYILEKKPGIKF